MSNIVLRSIGWCGTVLVLGGYLLLSLGAFSNDWPYHTCMLLGSLCLVLVSYKARLWEVVTLNICFALFACIALVRLSFFT